MASGPESVVTVVLVVLVGPPESSIVMGTRGVDEVDAVDAGAAVGAAGAALELAPPVSVDSTPGSWPSAGWTLGLR